MVVIKSSLTLRTLPGRRPTLLYMGVREGGLLLDGDLFLEMCLLQDHEDDLDLGRRGHREPRRRVRSGDVFAAPDIGEYPRQRGHLRLGGLLLRPDAGGHHALQNESERKRSDELCGVGGLDRVTIAL